MREKFWNIKMYQAIGHKSRSEPSVGPMKKYLLRFAYENSLEKKTYIDLARDWLSRVRQTRASTWII